MAGLGAENKKKLQATVDENSAVLGLINDLIGFKNRRIETNKKANQYVVCKVDFCTIFRLAIAGLLKFSLLHYNQLYIRRIGCFNSSIFKAN